MADSGSFSDLDRKGTGTTMHAMKIWDLPVRLFHWSLLVLVITSWISAEIGNFTVHFYSGYAIFTLVVFRVMWGLIGSDTARFSSFLAGPGAVLAYAKNLGRRKPSNWVGHNPVGGLSVFALLGLLAAQVTAGLFIIDVDFINDGPLSKFVSYDQGRLAAELHEFFFGFLQAVVALHIAAVLFYRFYKGEPLIEAMVTGWRNFPQDTVLNPPTLSPNRRALAVFALAVLIVWLVITQLPKL